ncbi:hypothetical protein TWF481_002665 [Arthrobotrys musiformis]|uniref:C2H2-type domain-containing protein n=1 Tax=Arthrobotrys musiformis TaxID=47236 RepID=A0AAV9VS25_9PEZI
MPVTPQQIIQLAGWFDIFTSCSTDLIFEARATQYLLATALKYHKHPKLRVRNANPPSEYSKQVLREFLNFVKEHHINRERQLRDMNISIEYFITGKIEAIDAIKANYSTTKIALGLESGAMGPLPGGINKIPSLMKIASAASNIFQNGAFPPHDIRQWGLVFFNFCSAISEPPQTDAQLSLRTTFDVLKGLTPYSACKNTKPFDIVSTSRISASTLLSAHGDQFSGNKQHFKCVLCNAKTYSLYILTVHWEKEHADHEDFSQYWPDTCTDCGFLVPYDGLGFHKQFCNGAGGLGDPATIEKLYPRFRDMAFCIDNDSIDAPTPTPGPSPKICGELLAVLSMARSVGITSEWNSLLGDQKLPFIIRIFHKKMFSIETSGGTDEGKLKVYGTVWKGLIELALQHIQIAQNRSISSVESRTCDTSQLSEWTKLPELVRGLLETGAIGEADATSWLQGYKRVCYVVLRGVCAPSIVHLAYAMFPFCRLESCGPIGCNGYESPRFLVMHIKLYHKVRVRDLVLYGEGIEKQTPATAESTHRQPIPIRELVLDSERFTVPVPQGLVLRSERLIERMPATAESMYE